MPRDDSDLIKRYRELRSQWLGECREYHEDAERLHGVAAGPEQWSEKDRKGLEKRRPFLSMNEIAPLVDAMSGRQITQRFERAYVPIDRKFTALAEVFEEVDRQVVKMADADQEESMAFRNGPNIARIGWVLWGWDSVEGKITAREWPIWDVIWPAMSTRRVNLQDRNGHSFGDWWEKDAFIARWGREKYDEAREKTSDGVVGFYPRDRGDPDKSSRREWEEGSFGSRERHGVRSKSKSNKIYVETWEERMTEVRYSIGMPSPVGETVYNFDLNGETFQIGTYADFELLSPQRLQKIDGLTRDDIDRLGKLHFLATGEEIREDLADARPMHVYKQHQFAAGGQVFLGSGDIPVQSFTLLAITSTPYPRPGYTKWISTTERLEDAQKWKNVFLTQLIRFIQISPKGSLIAEQGFFRQRGEALHKFASMGGYIEVDQGKLSSTAKPGYVIENGFSSPVAGLMGEMMSYHDSAFPRLVGFNSAMLGQLGPDLRRISGEVVRSMQDAAISSNANLFDAFSLYRKHAGQLILKFVDKFFAVEDVINIVGDKAYKINEDGSEELLIPPKDQWEMSKFKISIEDQTPDPDKRVTLWKILSEQGAFVLQALMSPHPITGRPVLLPEEVVGLLPDFPVYLQEKLAQRVKQDMEILMEQQQAQQDIPVEQAGVVQ